MGSRTLRWCCGSRCPLVRRSSRGAGCALHRMHKFAVLTERAVQICAALAALAFFTSGAVYLYLGRRSLTHYGFWCHCVLDRTLLETAVAEVIYHSVLCSRRVWCVDISF